jgi:predicted metalloprotease with PDZ domain
VLLRLTDMRGVDLQVFNFDFDCTWVALFLSSEGHVYGRFGGRDADSAVKYLWIEGLRYALGQALALHQRGWRPTEGRSPKNGREPRRVEEYPAAQRLPPKSCIHCHQVYDFRREARRGAGAWQREELWVYPEPANIGLSLASNQGNRVTRVAANSPASKAGLQNGDILRHLNGVPIASVADVQYALDRAPAKGGISVTWERDGRSRVGQIELHANWRVTDISWRWSLKSLQPAPCVHGEDLTAAEKEALGLSPKRLAFRQGNFVHPAARQAGIQINDIIIGINGLPLEMTARQFDAYVRINHKVGDTFRFNVIRDRERFEVPLKLP